MSQKGKYEQLSLDELRTLAAAIDREAEPERAAEIDELIARRKADIAQGDKGDVYPNSDLSETDEVQKSRLASRGERFAAAVIDTVISILSSIPIFFFVGLDAMQQPTLFILLYTFLYGFTAFLVIHGYLLANFGQTVGKKFLNIRIENVHGDKAPFADIVFKRYLPMSLVVYVPFIGNLLSLVDILFIFRSDRRCVHDHIAGTQVNRVPDAIEA